MAFNVSISTNITTGNSFLIRFLKNVHFWQFWGPFFDFWRKILNFYLHSDMGYQFVLNWPWEFIFKKNLSKCKKRIIISAKMVRFIINIFFNIFWTDDDLLMIQVTQEGAGGVRGEGGRWGCERFLRPLSWSSTWWRRKAWKSTWVSHDRVRGGERREGVTLTRWPRARVRGGGAWRVRVRLLWPLSQLRTCWST